MPDEQLQETQPEAQVPAMPVAELVKRYALPVSEEAVAALEASGQDLTEWARAQAIGLYPQFAKQIQAGVEPALLLDPFRQIAAQELERDVTLDDPVFRDYVVSSQQPSLAEFRLFVRQQPEWDETEGANRLAEGLLRRLEGL